MGVFTAYEGAEYSEYTQVFARNKDNMKYFTNRKMYLNDRVSCGIIKGRLNSEREI